MLCTNKAKPSPLISQDQIFTKQIKGVSYGVEKGFIYFVYWGC